MASKESKQSAALIRRERVFRLLLRGYSQHEIAKQLDSTDSVISRDVQALRKQAAERFDVEQFAEYLDRSEARLREVQRAAWRQFEETGDRAFLAEVRACEESVYKLRGLLQRDGSINVGVQIGSANYEDAQIVRVVVETREELAEFEAMSLSQLKQATVVDGKVVDAGELFGAGETAGADGETKPADGETNGHAGGKLNGKANGKTNGKTNGKPKPKPKDTDP